jgi:hypothetical protein
MRCGVPGQSPSLTLEGQINPDGTATLVAQGISAGSDHNIKFAPPRFIPSHQVYSGTGPRWVATDLIAASVMAAAFRAESGFIRRPLNLSAA